MSAELKMLHEPFIKFLRSQGLPYIRARSDRQSTIAKGAHDFTVLSGSSALCIEFKHEGSLSKEQKDWIEQCAKAGVKVHVVRELRIAVELVNAWRTWMPPIAPGTHLHRYGNALYRQTPNGLEKVRNA